MFYFRVGSSFITFYFRSDYVLLFLKRNYQDQDFSEAGWTFCPQLYCLSHPSRGRVIVKSGPDCLSSVVRQAQSPRVKTRAVLAAVASGNSSLSLGEEEPENDEVSHLLYFSFNLYLNRHRKTVPVSCSPGRVHCKETR